MIGVGDFVFAKMRGFPPWPAVVERIIREQSGKNSKNIFEVYFFGTHQKGFVREIDLFPYEDNVETFQYGSKRNTFCSALKEIEEERSACCSIPHTSNDPFIPVKDCMVLERTLLEKMSPMNIPGDHSCIIEDNVHLLYNSVNKEAETQDCSDMESRCIESPVRLFYNGTCEDSEKDFTLVGEESPNLECRSSTVREAPTKCPSQSAVRRLFEEKPAQRRQEDILRATSPTGSRRLPKVINCRISPILFIESDETDSSEDMTTDAEVYSHSSSQKPVLREENIPEVELLSQIHGLKRSREQLDAGFHDLPTPPRLDSVTISHEKMFDNSKARKSLEGLSKLCDISTPKYPKLASKLSYKQLENSDSRIFGIELEKDGQKLQEVNLHDLSSPKCVNDSVILNDNLIDKCRPRPAVCGRENMNPQAFRSEGSLNENSKTYNSRTNDTREAGGASNRLIHIISNDNLRQIGPFSISRFDGPSVELEEYSPEPKKPFLLLGCGKNGLSLTNISTESRKESLERRSNILQESGNSLLGSGQRIEGILNHTSKPLEIDLVSDSSDEEKLSPCLKRMEYDRRSTDSVAAVSNTLSNDRDALLAFSRARWKARNKMYTSTESSITKHSLHSRQLETFRHLVPSSQNISVSDPNTTKGTSINWAPMCYKRNTAFVKQDKYKNVNSTLHGNVDFINPSVPVVQDRPTLKPATVNKDPLLSGCSQSVNNVFSLRNSNIDAGGSRSPIHKENKFVHQPKHVFPTERLSVAFDQANISLCVSSYQQSTTADKEQSVVTCVSSQSSTVPGHLNEVSSAGSGTIYASVSVSLQSRDVRVNENDITRTARDHAAHTIRSGSDLRLPKRQLESEYSSAETCAQPHNSTVTQECERDRPALSKTPNQNQSALCYSVNVLNNQSRNEISPVCEGLDSTVLSCSPTNPEVSPNVITYLTEQGDSAEHTTECLTRPKFKIPSHLSAHGVPLHHSSQDVSFTVDQSSLEPVSGEFSELSPTHRRIVTSNCASAMETDIGINQYWNAVDSSNSVIKESSAGTLSGARDKEMDTSQEVATNLRSKDDCEIDRASQSSSRNETAVRRTSVSSTSYSIPSKYSELFKKTAVVKLHRLKEATVQSLLSSTPTSPKEDSEILKDGSKKRKTCPPKKLHSPEKYSNYGCSNDIQKTPNQVSSSEVNDCGVACGSVDAVGVRSQVSDAKTNQQLLRRKMFSLAWGERREDTIALKSNGLLMNHQKQTPEETNVSGEIKNASSIETSKKDNSSFTENRKRKLTDGNGKRGLKRCDVCWHNVENVTEHIINDHSDMFYSKNNL